MTPYIYAEFSISLEAHGYMERQGMDGMDEMDEMSTKIIRSIRYNNCYYYLLPHPSNLVNFKCIPSKGWLVKVPPKVILCLGSLNSS